MKNSKNQTNHDHFKKGITLQSLFVQWVSPKIGHLQKGSLQKSKSLTADNLRSLRKI